jgi:serine/threonine-protein kinase
MTTVFVSYSHDSAAHNRRVLQLAEALRRDGIDASIDVDFVRPPHGWPHWCEEQLRPEKADFVLLICTPGYRDRVENRVAFDEGRGAFWEGSMIYDYVYDAKGNRRFIPLLLDGATESCIPRPLRNHTHYAIRRYDIDDRGYRKLYRELTQQNRKRKPTGDVVALEDTIESLLPQRLPAPTDGGSNEPAESHKNLAELLRRNRRTVSMMGALLAVTAGWFFVRSCHHDKPMPAAVAPILTLAVLPFKPLLASKRNEALEMGMADTLIERISTIDSLSVRPLTAVRRYGGMEQDPVAAGRALDVDAVLDGSILDNGSQIRVIVRMLRVVDGSQLASGRFDTPSTTVFALLDRISSFVVEVVRREVTEEQRARLHRRDTHDPEAYREYLLGSLYSDRADRERYLKAIEHFERAIALDPGYARAYARLAFVQGALPICCDYPAGPSSAASKDAANKAAAIDPQLSLPHLVLGREAFFYDWDWRRAEEELLHALQLEPANAELHRTYAHFLLNTGRQSEALRQADDALQLDPVSLMNNTLRAQFLLQSGDVEAAIEADRRALEIDPAFWVARMLLGNAYLRKAKYVEALEEYRVAYAHSAGATEPRARAAYLLARTGRKREARKILIELTALSRVRYVPPYNLALVDAGLGEHAEALRELRRACVERDVRLIFIRVDSAWDVLRSEPGWPEVERCIKLPPVVDSQINSPARRE